MDMDHVYQAFLQLQETTTGLQQQMLQQQHEGQQLQRAFVETNTANQEQAQHIAQALTAVTASMDAFQRGAQQPQGGAAAQQGRHQQQAPQHRQDDGAQGQRLLIREVKLPRLGAPTATGVVPEINAAVFNSWTMQARLLCRGLAIEEAWPLWLAAMDGRYAGRLQTTEIHERPDSIVDLDTMSDYFADQYLPRETDLDRDFRIRQRVVYRRGMSAEAYVRLFQDEIAMTARRSDRPFDEAKKRELFLGGLQGVREAKNAMLIARSIQGDEPEAGMQGLYRIMFDYESLYREQTSAPLPNMAPASYPTPMEGVNEVTRATGQGRGRREPETRSCFHCNKPGHLKKDCRARRTELGQQPQRGRGNERRNRGRQAFARGVEADDYEGHAVDAVGTEAYESGRENVPVNSHFYHVSTITETSAREVKLKPEEAESMLWTGTIVDAHGGERQARVLIDSGATRNMVARIFADATPLRKMTTATKTTFRFANGAVTISDEYCPDVPLRIQGYSTTLPLLVCDLGTVDIVLGLEWLRRENPSINWSTGQVILRNEEYETIDSIDTEQGIPGVNDRTPLQVRKVVEGYRELFEAPTGLPPARAGHDHKITIKEGAQAPYRYPFRLSVMETAELEKQLEELLRKGHIRPSNSPYGAPTLFAKKKDGDLRFCTDYRALNEVTIRDRYPLPVIGEILDRVGLRGATIFSKMDCRSGYHQVRVREDDTHKTTFVTHKGAFEWRVLPMGLCNAPATFQRLMDSILGRFTFAAVYLDDIIVFSKSVEEHAEHVRAVLEALRSHGIRLHPKKCVFGQTALSFLGHDIAPGTIGMEADKVSAVRNWALPRTKKQLQSFVGFTNFYRDFVANYAANHAALPKPLPADAVEAFEELRAYMCRAPVLRMVSADRGFVVTTDASDEAIACVLQQIFDDGEAPVAFKSRKLSPAEKNYSARDRELLALVYATKVWRHYLLDRRFVIRTDHESLQHWRTMATTGGGRERRLHRWTEQLADFDFDVIYIKGVNNVADGLTRNGAAQEAPTEEQDCGAVTEHVAQVQVPGTSEAELREDAYFAPILQILLEGEATNVTAAQRERAKHFAWDGCNLNKEGSEERRRCVAGEKNQRAMVAEYHATPAGGHAGRHRTAALLSMHFFWPGMLRMVNDSVKKCSTCQRTKAKTTGRAPLHPIDAPTQPGECVTIDFVELPVSLHGNDYLLVVVDKLTKMVRTAPTTKTINAEGAAEVLLAMLLPVFGRLPAAIISDRDPRFTAAMWAGLWTRFGTKLKMTTAHRPQADGQSERMIRQVQEYLRAFVNVNGTDWDTPTNLAMLEFSINSHPSATTGTTAFELHLGRRAILPTTLTEPPTDPGLPLEARWRAARDAIHQAQERMVEQNGGSGRPDEVPGFKPGDAVLLNTRNYPQLRKNKLDAPFFGPLKVKRVLSATTVELVLPAGWSIHPVVNTDVLKRFVQDEEAIPPPPPIQDEQGRDHYLVERMTGRRTRRGRRECRIRWRGYDAETWEPESYIGRNFIKDYEATLPEHRPPKDRKGGKGKGG